MHLRQSADQLTHLGQRGLRPSLVLVFDRAAIGAGGSDCDRLTGGERVILDSGIGNIVPQRAASAVAERQASAWLYARIASRPKSRMKAIPSGAASQGVGARVPRRSN